MSDFYTEQLVKKQTTMKDVFKKAFLVALAIVSVFAVFLFPLAIIVPVVMITLAVVLIRRMDVEYEYLCVNGDLDIDKIMHKEKRKKLFSAGIDDIELLAPEGASELNYFKSAKELDFTSGASGVRHYVLVAKEKGQLIRVIFEPNDALIEGIFMLAPRKVIREK